MSEEVLQRPGEGFFPGASRRRQPWQHGEGSQGPELGCQHQTICVSEMLRLWPLALHQAHTAMTQRAPPWERRPPAHLL